MKGGTVRLERFHRIDKYGEPVTIVSGLPRSGTSMLMNMLAAAGIEIASDGIRRADNDNPEGYFELERVKELGKTKDSSWVRGLRGKAVKIISWILQYLPDENNYQVLFIERDLREVMASQNKMLLRRGKPADPDSNGEVAKNFEDHLREIKQTLHNRQCFRVLYVNHRDVINNPRGEAEKINRFLGGHLDEEKMAAAVNPRLYRNRI